MAKLIHWLVLGLVGCGGTTSGTSNDDADLGLAGSEPVSAEGVGGEAGGSFGVAGASEAMVTGGAVGAGGSLATGGAVVTGGSFGLGGAVGSNVATGGAVAVAVAGSVAAGGATVSPTVCRTLCNDDFSICSSERLFEQSHCVDTCNTHREMCALDCSGVIDACIMVCANNEATCSGTCFSACVDDCNTRACDYLDCDGEQTKCSAACQTNYTARMTSICFAARSKCLAACPT